MGVSRSHRRIRNLANLGFLPIALAIAILPNNDARLAAVVVAVVYAAVIGVLIVRASRCPQCKSLLSTRDLRIGRAKITVPWYFRSTCRRCGWSEALQSGASNQADFQEQSPR